MVFMAELSALWEGIPWYTATKKAAMFLVLISSVGDGSISVAVLGFRLSIRAFHYCDQRTTVIPESDLPTSLAGFGFSFLFYISSSGGN